jgi:hypothetical protein
LGGRRCAVVSALLGILSLEARFRYELLRE